MSLFGRIRSEWAYVTGIARALRRARPIARHPDRTVRELFEDFCGRFGDRPALMSATEILTYRQLNERANQYCRWAQAEGIGRGDVVGLLMPNRPQFVAAWAGIVKAGGVTALLNTNLPGASLAHCIDTSQAKLMIVDAALLAQFETARPFLQNVPRIFVVGALPENAAADLMALTPLLDVFATGNPQGKERVPLTIEDRCLYIYTSGTTGLPKAANMNHYRVQLAMLGYAGLTNTSDKDRVYITLPMYHTVGGLCATGCVLVVGGSCYIREKFSAREFWADIIEHDCTMFAYIGELCRYLLAQPPAPTDKAHRIRICFGNGLRPDIFVAFRDRFGVKNILEYYASTEGNVTLFNFDSKPGAVGRLPKWMQRSFVVKIVKFDVETEMPVRGPDGRCIECGPNEIGEAIGKILEDPDKPAARFEGYVDRSSSEKKILRDVFAPGDAWFRSGDLMRRDELNYFYFIDRIGDTFRWKGENVSTTEVAEAISSFPGVREVNVYGVGLPLMDGRAGMAALVVDSIARFDFAGFHAWLSDRLPEYARPLFLRFQDHLEVTSTFKTRKVELVSEGFDPVRVRDPLFFHDPRSGTFVPIDEVLYEDVISGKIRL
jgi:fatty-acyl-CoA synthase